MTRSYFMENPSWRRLLLAAASVATVIWAGNIANAQQLPGRDLSALARFGCEGILARRPTTMRAVEQTRDSLTYRVYHLDGVTLRTVVDEADKKEHVADVLMPSRLLTHMGVIEPDDMRGFQAVFGTPASGISTPPEHTFQYSVGRERLQVHFGKMGLLHWIVWTCAHSDARMPPLQEEHAKHVPFDSGPDLSPRQRTDVLRVARPATPAACPSRDFIAFARAFFNNGDLQRAFTLLPLSYSFRDPGDGYEEKRFKVQRFDNIPSMARDGSFVVPWQHSHFKFEPRLSADRRSATVTVSIPDTGFNVHYTFRLGADCWQLTAVQDRST